MRADQAKASERLLKAEEQAAQPRSIEALRALEAALGKVAAHLYDSETRTREGLVEMRAELGGLAERVTQIGEADVAPSQAMIDGVVSRIVQRLEEAEARTSGAVHGLESSLNDFDFRLKAAEAVSAEPGRRLEELAQELSRNFEAARQDLAERLEAATDARLGAVESSLREVSSQVSGAEQRSTQAMERMGREVLRVAEALGKRMESVETRSSGAMEHLGGEVARIAEAMEGRLRKADHVQANSLERLGGEIARITERLADRIANAERRSAQAIDGVGEQVSRITERLNQRQERSSTDLAERIRQSEERTALLLEEAREKIDQRLAAAERRLSEEVARQPAPAPQRAPVQDDASSLFAEPDLPPGPFQQEGFTPGPFARRGGAPAGFVPPVESLPSEPERSPFEGDDFDAAAMFEAFNAEGEGEGGAEPELAGFEADHEAFQDEAAAAAVEPEPALEPASRPSTRELIEQARAAARAAAQEGEGGAKKGLFPGLGAKKTKKPASRLKTGLMVAAAMAMVGVTSAGIVLYTAQQVDHGRKTGGGLLAAASTRPAAPASLATPQAAVALAPQLIPQASSSRAGGADLASVYADAVRRIEAKDGSGVEDIRKAANLGYGPAEFYLAKLYETGDGGLAKNPAQARRWTERAAENGERRAMHNLALYEYEGTGGPKDTALAVQWFKKAAGLGLVDSQYNLARLYEGGLGVAANAAEAYKWYLIAARSGDGESRAAAERVKKTLSADARSAAERSARAFHVDNPLAAAEPVAPAAPAAAPDVILAQRALAKLGYYKGPADGKASPALKLAISSYQKAEGLTPTGALDPDLAARFAKAAG